MRSTYKEQSSESTTTLFGRSNEFKALKNAYKRVKDEHSFERIAVHGEAGTGKTALVMALQEKVLADNGFFCSGKYFQNSDLGQEPYSAIMSAFSDLCDIILQSSDFNEDRKATIQSLLGSDGNMLLNTVTNISPFLADEECNRTIEDSKTMFYCSIDKLKNACRSFIQAMCSTGNPLVLFVDDIQWMDEGSKNLLNAIAQDTRLENFMLVLAYRSNDGDFFVEDLYSSTANSFITITLSNLEIEHVKKIVTESLRITHDESIPAKINDLCIFIASRTQGNPFFIKHFLELLANKKLCVYDKQSCDWICDINAIQKNTMIHDSLAEVLSGKIMLLDEDTKKLLKMLSLLGYAFSFRMVLDFASDFFEGLDLSKKLKSLLKKATEANVLEETHDGFQFTHEKVQNAFRGIIEKGEKSNIHLKIGLKLLKRSDDVFKYAAAIHMNYAVDYFSDNDDNRVVWADTNLRASKYCMTKFAFSDATTFLQRGLSLLGNGETKWSRNFDLALEITDMLVQLEFILGNTDACLLATEEILRRAKTKKTRLNAIFVKINALTLVRDCNSADFLLETRKNILDEIGIAIPRIVTSLHCLKKVKKLRRLIDKRREEDILALPRTKSEVNSIPLLLLSIGFYFLSRKKTIFTLYAFLLAAEHTLENGFSEGSIRALNFFGKIEVEHGHFDRAYRIGTLALKVIPDQVTPDDAGFDIMFSMSNLLCLKERLQMNDSFLFKPVNLNYHLGRCNIMNVIMFGVLSFNQQLWTGEHLEVIEKSMTEIIDRLSTLNQQLMMTFFQPMLQSVLNLRNNFEASWDELVVLNSQSANSEGELLDYISSLHPCAGIFYLCWKIFLAYSFGLHEKAESLIPLIDLKMIRGTMTLSLPMHLYFSLTYYARYQSTRQLKYLHKARKFQKYLRRVNSSGNPNAAPYLRIAEAVDLSLNSKSCSVLEVCNNFDKTINLQKTSGLVHLEVLANEQAGFALLHMDHENIESGNLCSLAYFKQAMEVSQSKWGATAKCRYLREKVQNMSPCRNRMPVEPFNDSVNDSRQSN